MIKLGFNLPNKIRLDNNLVYLEYLIGLQVNRNKNSPRLKLEVPGD